MFVIKNNTIESIKLPGLLGSNDNHDYTLQPWGVNNSGVIVLPEILNNENQFLVNNNALNDVITTTTSSTTAYFITNDNEIVGKILPSTDNNIILLSSSNNNSFTLSTKVKRAYVSMSGVSTENNCPLGYCTGLYYTYLNRYKNSILLFLSNEAQEIIHNNVCILVNISIIGQIIGNNVSSTDVIAGFMPYSFATNRNFYNGHQSSLTYSSDQYVNFYESFVTWESIINLADTYCLQLITSIIDPSNTSSDIVIPFSGIIYYRLEMIVYEG